MTIYHYLSVFHTLQGPGETRSRGLQSKRQQLTQIRAKDIGEP